MVNRGRSSFPTRWPLSHSGSKTELNAQTINTHTHTHTHWRRAKIVSDELLDLLCDHIPFEHISSTLSGQSLA